MPRTFLQIIHEFSIQTYFFMQYPRSTKNRSNNLFIGILHQGIGVIYVAEIFTWTQGGYPRSCMGENGAKIITPQRCPSVFQGHPSNFKVTWDKTSPILTQIGHFRTIGRSQLSNPSDWPCWRSSVKYQGHTAKKNRIFWPKLGVSGL